MATILKSASDTSEVAWRRFAPGIWQRRVDVREFIQRNYTPYEGDGAFLQGTTQRTRGMWETLQPLLAKEREKGILDVSQIPSGILAHAPGYIDKDREIIVGLQTDVPLKPAIMPFGGWRVVAASLEAYGYKPDPAVEQLQQLRDHHGEARRETTRGPTIGRPGRSARMCSREQRRDATRSAGESPVGIG